jgi:oligogalacturonide lyase
MTTNNKGRIWAPEWSTFPDPTSGVTVRQLTNYRCHDSHLYFTNRGWYAGGQKLLIVSDREDATNLLGIDLSSGEMTQLTDFGDVEVSLQGAFLNPVRDQICFYLGDDLVALDLDSLEITKLYTRPEGYNRGGLSITSDGKYVLTAHSEDLTGRFPIDLAHGYIGFREIWEAHPHCMVVKIALDGSGHEVVYEENYWVGHINTSPTLPHIMTFCHEGPWNLVENRIWGLNHETGDSWMLRPNAPDEAIGHEYWMADGEHIGYHGRTPDGPVYGSVRYNDTERVEAPFTYGSMHFHSKDLGLIVGDGGRQDPYVLIWRFRDGAFEGPKVLATHRGSFHIQRLHVHPCVSLDGSQVVYTADPQGYGQVYMVDIPEFDALPDRDSI